MSIETQGSDTLENIATYFDDRYGNIWRDAYGEESEAWYEYHPLRIREFLAIQLVKDSPKGCIIDLGCGNGHAAIQMSKLGFHKVIGIDISDEMLTAARQLAKNTGSGDSIELFKSDVQEVSVIESGSADACTALGVIEYLDEDERFLSEVHRLLKPGGIAVIQTRNYNCIYMRTRELIRRLIPRLREKIEYREHKPDDFRESIEKSGLRVEQEYFSHFYALYPFTLVPLLRKLIKPLDAALSKKCERFATYPIASHLASMHIVKLRKTD